MDAQVKVYRMNDYEWWVGKTLESTKRALLKLISKPYRENAITEPRMLRHKELMELTFIDPDNGNCTFAKQLELERAKGGKFPRPFATTEI